MFRKYGMGAETPRFRRGKEAPQPCRGLRPCEVDGKACLFHGWVRYNEERLQIDYFIKQGREEIMRTYRETGVLDAAGHIVRVAKIAALVEYPDGSVGRVMPELITFLDRREG